MATSTTVSIPDEVEAREMLDRLISQQMLETGTVVDSYLDLDIQLPEHRRTVAACYRLMLHPLLEH